MPLAPWPWDTHRWRPQTRPAEWFTEQCLRNVLRLETLQGKEMPMKRLAA